MQKQFAEEAENDVQLGWQIEKRFRIKRASTVGA
jgi:hypothetical protein